MLLKRHRIPSPASGKVDRKLYFYEFLVPKENPMRTRFMMMIWFAVLLLVGSVLLGACGGSTPSADLPVTTTESATEETPVIDG